MSNDKTRQEFEAWAATKGMAMHLARAESGLYVSRVTQNYMDCWMASRAAVVVDLPKPWQTNVGAMLTPNGVRFAIEAAGLKVKP
ncbi:hypothetical protein [Pseudomonas sp. CFBP 13719]|uniref:hypothetical protein n=1 Tax=Pseudomonas sp. CFBP 13719 TaxID=2775303 RepID=UPI00177D8FD4|nr:hypothetical protein [Pseudomonas sp. CFBP 13719]MBD8680319.1 hypothetical protein [Pseudomonas sp. CFBP 13719]